RLLPDGTVLVADNVEIKRVRAADATHPNGEVLQRYDVPGHDRWFSLNLDPDGQSFWSGDFETGQIHRFRIADGVTDPATDTPPIDTIFTGFGGQLFGVSVFNEPTQAATTQCTLTVAATGATCGNLTFTAQLACGALSVANRPISFSLDGSAI